MPENARLKAISNQVISFLLLFLAFNFVTEPVYAQNSRILEIEDQQIYELISKLQNRGYLLSLNPDQLPYKTIDVWKALNEAKKAGNVSEIILAWLNQLEHIINKYVPDNSDVVSLNFQGYGSTEFNNTERKNVYRPLSEDLYFWPALGVNGSASRKTMILNGSLLFDYYYDQDPDGLDAVNRLYTRNENAYVGYTNDFLEIYMGRYSNQWGLYNQGSTFLSANPRTFDHANFKIKARNFTISTIYGYLDSISGEDEFTGSTRIDRDSKRRFVSLKRIDWRPTERLIISYKESILYSGFRAIPEPKYLLPVNVFTFLADNAPQNDVINLLFGLSVWTQIENLTFRAEYMFDDIIFNQEERGISERNTFSFILNTTYAFKKLPVDINSNLEVISYQSYNTDQPEGRYLYLRRGLATQFTDYVFADLSFDLYLDKLISGLRISPYTGYLAQGEQEINQTFESEYEDGSRFESVLTGNVTHTKRAGINLFYSPHHLVWFKADLGVNFSESLDHIIGNDHTQFKAMVEAGFSYRLDAIN